MATPSGIDFDLQRRLALSLPPSELRDDYLCWLDGQERSARLAAGLPERSAEPAAPPAGDEAPSWTLQRYVVTGVGAVLFATGTWLVTSLL
jgi:hypothetical protein